MDICEDFDMTMYFDGSKCEQGGGARVVFFTPHGVPIPYSFKLVFPCTNNNIEYKSFILGFKTTINCKFEILSIYGGSILVFNKILGVYQCHNDLLKYYREVILKLLKWFNVYNIEETLRSSNRFVNTMASLGLIIPLNPHRKI